MSSLSDIVDNIHKNGATGATKDQITTIVNSTLAAVGDDLKRGEEVRLHNFGSFSINKRPARTGRNPATGSEIQIAASNQVKFKPSKALKDKVA